MDKGNRGGAGVVKSGEKDSLMWQLILLILPYNKIGNKKNMKREDKTNKTHKIHEHHENQRKTKKTVQKEKISKKNYKNILHVRR